MGIAPGVNGGIDIRAAAESAFASALQLAGISKTELGFEHSGSGSDSRIEFSGNGAQEFRQAVQKRFADIREFFVGRRSPDVAGFAGRLISAVNTNLQGFPASARAGVIIDTLA